MSIISEDIRNSVSQAFTNKKSRAAAFELLIWKAWPTASQREEIGKRNDVSGKTVLKVLRKLQEMELFTEAEGSIPMYGDTMRREAKPSMEPKEEVDRKEEREEGENGEETAEHLEETTEPPEDLGGLRNKVFRLEAEVGTIRKNMETIVPIIKGLSSAAQSNPSTAENKPAQNASTPAEAPAEVQPASELVPELLAGLSREQIIDMGVTQPGMLRRMLGLPPKDEDEIMSLPVTTRVVAVELNTYTQSVYERTVHDGYNGTLSDFLNDAADMYFRDRGKALQWVDVPPRLRRGLPA